MSFTTKFSISFLILIALSGCTKFGKTITVEGKVMNPLTGKGLEGATVELIKLTPKGFQEKEKETKSVQTNENGEFEINKLGLTKDFVLAASNVNSYFRLGWAEDGKIINSGERIEVIKGKKSKYDYYVLPFGKMREEIHNIVDPHPNDLMQYRRKAWYDSSYGPWSSYILGPYDYNGSDLQIVPVGYWYYETKLTRNAQDYYFYDSVYVNDFGVATVLINY